MKKPLFFAFVVLFSSLAAQAQVTPTTPQRGGTMNQTTVPPTAPSNPGTLDQRTPTSTSPTQMGTGTSTSPAQMSTGTITTNHGEPMTEALRLAAATWHPTRDGVMMMDYSSQSRGERKGKHVASIEEDLFREFVEQLQGLDVDIMLEIKDKEVSAHRACTILRDLSMVPAAPAGYVPPTFPDPSAQPATPKRKAAAKQPAKATPAGS